MAVNTSIELLQPLFDGMNHIMNRLEILLGGVFGLYVLFFLYRLYSEAKVRRMLKNITNRLTKIEKKLKIKKKK